MTESNGWITRRRFLYGTTGLTIGGLLGANFSTQANAATGYGFGAPPAAGVHPRVVITPAEVSIAKGRISGSLTQPAFNRLVDAPPEAALLTALSNGTISATDLERLAKQISGTALVALLGNSTQAPPAASAATNAVNTWVQKITPTNENHTGLTVHIALAYDWLFGTLTSTERTTIRTWLTARLDYWESRLDLLTYGFKQGPGEAEKRNFNWVPLIVGSFGTAALAVEGEAGYDSNWYTKSKASLYDFLNHGISQEGAPLELFHYFAYGMWRGSYLVNAMARRGDTVLDHAYLKRVPRWWTSDMLPWGGDWNSLQDTKDSTSGIPSIFYLLRLAYADDPIMRWVYKSYVGVQRDVYDDLAAVLWGSELDTTDGARTAASLAMNPTQYFIANGLQYMRSAWGTDDVYFQFQSDPYAGETHAHADRNAFTLMSDGRIWFCDAGMHIPWDYAHNVVHIDGKAEGYFPQRGRIVTRTDGGFATGIMGDAKDAYDWKTDATSGGTGWQQVNGLWSYPYNPVQRAFRSGTLVRGTNPYVLISDDIRKDDASHEYSWEALMPLGTAMVPLNANTVMLEPVDIGDSVNADGGSVKVEFKVPRIGNYRMWILSGRDYTTMSGGYNKVSFDGETQVNATYPEDPGGGDASKPHWIPAPFKDGLLVRNFTSTSTVHSAVITPIGKVTEVAFLMAPESFDPTGVTRPVIPAGSFLQRFSAMPLRPTTWPVVAAPTNYPRCMVKVLSPASVTVGVSTIRRYITDDENYGKAFKLKFRTAMVEPKFRVLLYPHRNGAPMPAVTSSSSQATLTWPDGTVDNWLFGPNTGFPAINGSAVSLTRGAESYTLGSA